LFVYAFHEQPDDQQCCPEEGKNRYEGKQTASERRIQEGQPTKASNHG